MQRAIWTNTSFLSKAYIYTFEFKNGGVVHYNTVYLRFKVEGHDGEYLIQKSNFPEFQKVQEKTNQVLSGLWI